MTLYFLEWDNSLDFGDRELTLLGVYTSFILRERAETYYSPLIGHQWPFMSGRFVSSEIEADTQLVAQHGAGQ